MDVELADNFEFPDLLPDEMRGEVNLSEFSRTHINWQFLTPKRPAFTSDELLITRLIEMTRLGREMAEEEKMVIQPGPNGAPPPAMAKKPAKRRKSRKKDGRDDSPTRFSSIFSPTLGQSTVPPPAVPKIMIPPLPGVLPAKHIRISPAPPVGSLAKFLVTSDKHNSGKNSTTVRKPLGRHGITDVQV